MAEDAVSRKISTLMDEGRSHDQAVAIALSMKERGTLPHKDKQKSPPPDTQGFTQTPNPASENLQGQQFTQTPDRSDPATAARTSDPASVSAANGPPDGVQMASGREQRGTTPQTLTAQSNDLASTPSRNQMPSGVQSFDEGEDV